VRFGPDSGLVGDAGGGAFINERTPLEPCETEARISGCGLSSTTVCAIVSPPAGMAL